MILVDGGRGQLRCTVKSLSSLGLEKPCFSLADSNEEIYSTRKYPLVFLTKDEGLKILGYVRNETRRFGHEYKPICAEKCLEDYKDEKKFIHNQF